MSELIVYGDRSKTKQKIVEEICRLGFLDNEGDEDIQLQKRAMTMGLAHEIEDDYFGGVFKAVVWNAEALLDKDKESLEDMLDRIQRKLGRKPGIITDLHA